jgi:hypothetical protein
VGTRKNPANERGWLWSQQLGLYLGIYENQLRYFSEQGELALQKIEELTAKLQKLGINPD